VGDRLGDVHLDAVSLPGVDLDPPDPARAPLAEVDGVALDVLDLDLDQVEIDAAVADPGLVDEVDAPVSLGGVRLACPRTAARQRLGAAFVVARGAAGEQAERKREDDGYGRAATPEHEHRLPAVASVLVH